MASIVYEGISFNAAWVASKPFKEFCSHEKHHGLSDEQMKEVYTLCGGKLKPQKKEESGAGEEEKEG